MKYFLQGPERLGIAPKDAAELDALGKALDNPARPVVAIVGGSKVSTKLDVLNARVAPHPSSKPQIAVSNE